MFLISNVLCLFLDQFYYTFVFFSSFLGMRDGFLKFPHFSLLALYFVVSSSGDAVSVCPLLDQSPLMEMPCHCVPLMIALAETLAASCLYC